MWEEREISTSDGTLIGVIWTHPDKGSFYVQVQHLPFAQARNCRNLGINFNYAVEAARG